MTKFIFFNGTLVPEEEGHVSFKDRGFLYGDSIYETLRSYHGKPFKLAEHLARLRNSAKQLMISLDYTNTEINGFIKELIQKNNTQNAYIRITLSRGTGNDGLGIDDNFKPTMVIHTKSFTSYESKFYEMGMSLVVSNWRRSTSCPISRHKTTNLLKSILLKEELKKKSAQEAIILNSDNHVAECIVSNIFMVRKGKVVTPPLDTNILPGITRRTVLDMCRNSVIPFSEESFTIERLIEAEEIFITNSLMEIMPVSKIEEYQIGKPVPGKITQHLMDAYKCLT